MVGPVSLLNELTEIIYFLTEGYLFVCILCCADGKDAWQERLHFRIEFVANKGMTQINFVQHLNHSAVHCLANSLCVSQEHIYPVLAALFLVENALVLFVNFEIELNTAFDVALVKDGDHYEILIVGGIFDDVPLTQWLVQTFIRTDVFEAKASHRLVKHGYKTVGFQSHEVEVLSKHFFCLGVAEVVGLLLLFEGVRDCVVSLGCLFQVFDGVESFVYLLQLH
jgi:hypothetical protein